MDSAKKNQISEAVNQIKSKIRIVARAIWRARNDVAFISNNGLSVYC